MPAPVLRHYNGVGSALGAWTTIVPAVPAGRVLVVSKLLVQSDLDGITFYAGLGPSPATGVATRVAGLVLVNKGQTFQIAGLTLLAGEVVTLNVQTGSVSSCSMHVWGQEVDG